MSKLGLYVPKNASRNGLLSYIDARIAYWDANFSRDFQDIKADTIEVSGIATLPFIKAPSLLTFKSGNTDVMAYDVNSLIHVGYIESGYGYRAATLGLPTNVRYGDANQTTGMYFESGNKIAFSANSIKSVGIESNGVKLYGSTSGNNSPYIPTKLSYYQEESFTTTWTPTVGTLILNPNITFQLTRVGNIINLTFQGMTSAVRCNSACYFDTTIQFPTQYRQKTGQQTYFFVYALIGGAVSTIILQIDTRLRLVSNAGGFLPTTTDIQVFGFSISWSILA